MQPRFTFLSLSLLVLSFGMSCTTTDDSSARTPRVYEGQRLPIGNGEAWTRVLVDADNTPLEVSAIFTSDALQNLPSGSHHAHEFVLEMPSEMPVAPFDHITLDWNEQGHAPPGVYDLPHFDVHFYFITAAARDQIGPNDSVGFNRPLPPDLLPPMYIETPGGVPRMGAHLIDAMSPEIAGTGPFTHTFIFGKYDAQLNFVEPMVSMDFLRARQDVTASIRQPARYSFSGYYPQEYAITFDNNTNTYAVSLADFTLHP